MRIVIDTNVVISGTFFGGYPRQILEAAVGGRFEAFATAAIVDEYLEIIDEMIDRKQGHIRRDILNPFTAVLRLIATTSKSDICRDPDDNKFLECAEDAKALYIVSGDKDLLSMGAYHETQIITAAEFCREYLNADMNFQK